MFPAAGLFRRSVAITSKARKTIGRCFSDGEIVTDALERSAEVQRNVNSGRPPTSEHWR